ncbi:substrate-binding domain-containing protein [Amphritea sp. HPY]|uniref:substrate-binding domain-containing protein n=1 Tax=Amphritea sp. HPY TaxID=3421652 RepID=UPI003D7CA712
MAVGTGKALQLGQNDDVDLVIVRATQAEYEFVDLGYGVDRTGIMYNDFIIVGPELDPAGIKKILPAPRRHSTASRPSRHSLSTMVTTRDADKELTLI